VSESIEVAKMYPRRRRRGHTQKFAPFMMRVMLRQIIGWARAHALPDLCYTRK
jgi:hypothetical protein